MTKRKIEDNVWAGLIISVILAFLSIGVLAYASHAITAQRETIEDALKVCNEVKAMNLDKLVNSIHAAETGEYLDYNLVCKPLEDALNG